MGANIPDEGLPDVIEQHDIHYVSISMTINERLDETTAIIDCLQAKFPIRKFIIGGQGIVDLPQHLLKYTLGHTLEDWEKWYRDFV